MARLRRISPSGNHRLDDSDFVQGEPQQRTQRCTANTSLPEALQVKQRSSPRKKATKAYCDLEASESDSGLDPDTKSLQPKISPLRLDRGKQIRLAPLNALSISRPPQSGLLLAKGLDESQPLPKIASPKKSQVRLKTEARANPSQPEIAESGDSAFEVDVEESVWCGSESASEDSEDELPSPRKLMSLARKRGDEQESNQNLPPKAEVDLSRQFKNLAVGSNRDSRAKKVPTKIESIFQDQSRPASSSDKENQGAFLRFSPPRLHSPAKSRSNERPITPPQSPSKSRLQSPSKTKTRIPTPPHRQSLDAFWNADTVNDWNEQYSPKKILKSPRKPKFLQDDSQQSPTSSPRKTQSPVKKTKAELEAKKSFEARKRGVAEAFLAELDKVVTHGKIQELAASTGGVHFVWSKTLNSTAGRANWRRETTKSKDPDGTASTTNKHHASIELAEKVIDDEDRLLNVIAHEFCHLANFMVSGIKGQPHGKQFKEWGRKCTEAFGDKGVKVTTKHSYQIEYKYIWQCINEECGVDFKRHSKSIDLNRHTCGTCRSRLVQIKPVPRKDAGNGTGYASYVKANFAAVKKNMPAANQKEVMEAVGRKYRADKEAKSKSLEEDADPKLAVSETGTKAEVDKVARVLEFVTLNND